ncbi:MAG: hypothetical protein AB1452_05610 [Pseudomonadota bacterium]
MTVFFQHVGEAGAARDFPRTIGTERAGLIRYELSEISTYLHPLLSDEVESIEAITKVETPKGFQIWGIPAGARPVLRRMAHGDYLLLLETIGEGGLFTYGGRVVARLSRELPAFSKFLWTEARFPIIIFLDGDLLRYGWPDFRNRFGFAPNFDPRGRTYRLLPDRIRAAGFASESAFWRHVQSHVLRPKATTAS